METAEIVLSSSEENSLRADRRSIRKRSSPDSVTAPNVFALSDRVLSERHDGSAPQDAASGLLGTQEQSLIERATRERHRLKRELPGDDRVTRGEAKRADRFRSKTAQIDAQLIEIMHGFSTEELAADFVMRSALT